LEQIHYFFLNFKVVTSSDNYVPVNSCVLPGLFLTLNSLGRTCCFRRNIFWRQTCSAGQIATFVSSMADDRCVLSSCGYKRKYNFTTICNFWR